MEDIVPGYNEAKESLLAKMVEPIEMYLLTKLKLDQMRSYPRQNRNTAIEEDLKANMRIHSTQVYDILIQQTENQ